MSWYPTKKTKIHIYQGKTLKLESAWTIAGEPVDITDYIFRMQVKTSYSDEEPIEGLDLDNGDKGGIEIISAIDGKFRVTVSAEVTAALDIPTDFPETIPPSITWYWDLEAESPDGEVTLLFQGEAIGWAEITK